jgi:hypothetical protein
VPQPDPAIENEEGKDVMAAEGVCVQETPPPPLLSFNPASVQLYDKLPALAEKAKPVDVLFALPITQIPAVPLPETLGQLPGTEATEQIAVPAVMLCAVVVKGLTPSRNTVPSSAKHWAAILWAVARSLLTFASTDLALAFPTLIIITVAKMPIIATTTNNSIRVKAFFIRYP